MKCQACNQAGPGVERREVWMKIGAVELGLRADLCASCKDTAPERIRRELQSPMIGALVKIAGVKLGFLAPGGTAPA